MWSKTIASSGVFVRSAVATTLTAAKSTASCSRNMRFRHSLLVVQQTSGGAKAARWKATRSLSTLSGTSLSTTSSQSTRSFSSRSSSDDKKGKKRFDLQALPFSVSPEEALDSFRKWAEDDQGLRYLMNYQSVRIGAAYVPVWSFDVNIRFHGGPEAKNWKPEMFQVYDEASGPQSVIYVPGLSTYAGYSYRRSLINPVHSTTLVFMGDKTEPFGGWMLRDMVLRPSGNRISVVPDAWNATYGRAFSIVKEDLQDIVNHEWPLSDRAPPTVQTEVVSSRRVFLPTYVIDYKIMGLEYRAFVSGCDPNAPVGGVSHQIFGNNTFFKDPVFHQESRNFLSTVSDRASTILRRFNFPMLIWIFRPFVTAFWFIFLRLWAAFPIVGAAGGLFAGFRKIVQPWMDSRRASADWERQREHESEMTEDADSVRGMNDFEDLSGSARKYFNRHKTQILRSLSGEFEHEEGDFDWYTDWQAWAQQQWARQAQSQQQQQQQAYQQQQQAYQQQSYQQQYRQQQQKAKPKDEYKWPFNPDDPYSVLGIDRNASDKDVSNAFRKEMLKYHPDTQPNASEAQKRRNTERSKLISEAYRKIKSERKGKRS